MVTLTRPMMNPQETGHPKERPECQTISETSETSSNEAWLNHALSTQVFAPDGEGGFFLHPEQMLEGYLYTFMLGDAALAVVKQADGHVALYGLSD